MKRLLFIWFVALWISPIQLTAEEATLYLQNIVIKGNNTFQRKELLDQIKITENRQYHSSVIKESIDKIKLFYHKAGYSLCDVRGYLDLDSNLIIEIAEGIIQDVFFVDLSYVEAYLFRQDFGTYQDKVFYKPLIEEKIKSVGVFKGYNKYEYYFVPVPNRFNYYTLYIVLKKEVKTDLIKANKLETKINYFFSFRGWLLSLVPYFWVDVYNWGGIDHNLRLRVDWRFSTILWKDFIYKESIESQDYTANYYSPPFYKQLRLNLYTAALLSYHNSDPKIWVGFDKTQYPIEVGVGFDFGDFYTSMRTGFLYEKIQRLKFTEYDLVEQNYPELTKPETRRYQTFSLNFSRIEDKQFFKERDDKIVLELKYTFNEQFSWFRGEINTQKYLFDNKQNIFVFRYRAFCMFGKYPIFSLYGFSDEFHLRGYGGLDPNYKFISIVTNRGMDATLESWVSIYQDTWYQIFFMDAGWFNDKYFNVDIATGEFGLTYGIGAAFNFYELHFRLLYGLPIKQRADKGTISWFLRRRF